MISVFSGSQNWLIKISVFDKSQIEDKTVVLGVTID